MNKRIKYLRKYFKMTQEEFATKLGVKRGAIANYEIGRNIPADSVISLICKVFNVNEKWLRTGEGGEAAAFDPVPTDDLDALAKAQGLTHDQYVLLQKFIGLKPEIRQGILDYIVDVAASVGAAPNPVFHPGPEGASKEELHAELDRQIQEEKTAEEASGAS